LTVCLQLAHHTVRRRVPLADEITSRRFAVVARHLGADLDALIADNLFLDAERHRRWTTALVRFAIAGSPTNRKHLGALIAKWRPLAEEVMATGGRLLGSFSSGLNSADEIADLVAAAWRDFLGGTGLQIK
jgi:hypothetical protein